jgi:hypothetical protein
MIICRTPYAGANRIRFNGTLSAGDGRVAGTPVIGRKLEGAFQARYASPGELVGWIAGGHKRSHDDEPRSSEPD